MSTFWLKIVASDHIFYNGNCETLVVLPMTVRWVSFPTMRP